MLRALLLALTLLLPLLGLQGQAMATPSTAAVHAAHGGATAAGHDSAAQPPQHAGATDQGATHDCCDGGSSSDHHQGSCAQCSACHTALHSASAAPAGPPAWACVPRPARTTRFASAALARTIKPPIS